MLKGNFYLQFIINYFVIQSTFKMSKEQQHIEDIQTIKDIMTKSTRFMSLSGISGVLAGTYALVAAYLAYSNIYTDQAYFEYRKAIINTDSVISLTAIAVITLVLTIGSGVFFSIRKAKRDNEIFWNKQAKRLLVNLVIPLATGGALCVILLSKGYIGVIAPLTLIFYGLALVNASKYTLTEVRSLGLLEIFLGLIAMQFIGYGLLFWAIGFGILHIVYGLVMYLKHGA